MKQFLTLYYLLSTLTVTIFYNCNAKSYLVLTSTINTQDYTSTSERIFEIQSQNQETKETTKENIRTSLDDIFKTDKNRKIPRLLYEFFSLKPENKLWKFVKAKGDTLIEEINKILSDNFKYTLDEQQKGYTVKEVNELEINEIKESKEYNDNLSKLKQKDQNTQKTIPIFIELPNLFTKTMHYIFRKKFPTDLELRKLKYQNKKGSSLITSDYFWIHQNDLTPKETETVYEYPNEEETRELIAKKETRELIAKEETRELTIK